MKNKFVISEEEKNRIINLYEINSKNIKTISEALGGQDQSSIDRMKAKYPNGFEFPATITASGSNTFANGVDTINKNDPKIKEILLTISDLLKTTTGKVNVVVSGGASKVGASSGYDNQALATRRRDNLINLIRNNWTNPKLVVIPGDVKVGDATKKDSDAAKKEQYVSASISAQGKMNIPIKGVEGDNTNVYRPEIFKNKQNEKIPILTDEQIRLCLRIPTSKKQSFLKMLNTWAKENGLEGQIPWRETKIE